MKNDRDIDKTQSGLFSMGHPIFPGGSGYDKLKVY
jgi:hypothetical protein